MLDDQGRAIVNSALNGEPMPERFDLSYRHADGSIVIGETQTTLFHGGLQGVGRDVTVRCPASIGWADTRATGHDAAALLAAADAAMYEVKRARHGVRDA